MSTNKAVIAPICYLPPISVFKAFLHSSDLLFDICEHFIKQTIRSRCSIYGANGKLDLIIPIRHTGEHVPMRDVKISYDYQWQKLHWRSLECAYRSSPYFEYYEHRIAPFYQIETEFLVDFNFALIQLLTELLEVKINRSQTENYKKEYPEMLDLRNNQTCKDTSEPISYYQVFANKHGFISDLSIIDLLFNEGPGARTCLET